jgi:hypothetical protein
MNAELRAESARLMLIADAARLFRNVTVRLNILIAYRRTHDPRFDTPALAARQQRLERIRRRAFKRWVRRGGPSYLTAEEYTAYDDD